MMDEEETKKPDHILENLKLINNVLETGKDAFVENPKLGKIYIKKGCLKTAKRNGFGLLHIIEERLIKDNRDIEFITALLPLILEAAKNGDFETVERTFKGINENRFLIEENGIRAVVSIQRNQRSQKFILTGYDLKGKEKKATDAIQTVIALYGYTPEFSSFRKQVGAVASQLNIVNNEPNGKEKTMKKPKRNPSPKQLQALEKGREILCDNIAQRKRAPAKTKRTAKPKKTDLYKFVFSQNMKYAYNGVFHKGGVMYATNGTIGIREKRTYPPEYENKIIHKNGKKINATYPKFDAVIPSEQKLKNNYLLIDIDFHFIKEVTKEMEAINRLINKRTEKKLKEYQTAYDLSFFGFKVHQSFFSAKNIKPVFDYGLNNNIQKVYVHKDRDDQVLIMKNGSTVVLGMPFKYKKFDDSNPFIIFDASKKTASQENNQVHDERIEEIKNYIKEIHEMEENDETNYQGIYGVSNLLQALEKIKNFQKKYPIEQITRNNPAKQKKVLEPKNPRPILQNMAKAKKKLSPAQEKALEKGRKIRAQNLAKKKPASKRRTTSNNTKPKTVRRASVRKNPLTIGETYIHLPDPPVISKTKPRMVLGRMPEIQYISEAGESATRPYKFKHDFPKDMLPYLVTDGKNLFIIPMNKKMRVDFEKGIIG